jgi:MoxR-like ATPase
MLLEKLGIFGWKPADENLVLASLLTGDPLLLIGNHGSAKTHLAVKIAQALKRPFLVYDASKAMFEDVLGFPNIKKLKQGIVEYVPSKVTVWDKELILIDELNRAIPELQSKWLEIIRSRKIMGFETSVKWVWAAMNPLSYSATQALDEALIGRFAIFLYPPDVLQMNEKDRIKVTTHINGDDAPSMSV